jgi:hypothetical protein
MAVLFTSTNFVISTGPVIGAFFLVGPKTFVSALSLISALID